MPQPKELFDGVRAARDRYQRLTAVYDSRLQAAHAAIHGSVDFVQHIRAANTMAHEVSEALQRYHMEVRKLFAFYNSKAGR
jgi:hypothetical protein